MNRLRWPFVLFACLGLILVSNGCRKVKPKSNLGGDDEVFSSELFNPDSAAFAEGDRPEGIYGEGGEAFEVVYFGYDSSQVQPSERTKVEAAADYLSRHSGAGIIVEGHCDERGSREYNLALGERRALAVRAYLIGLGIDSGRIQTKSLGEEQPAAFGHDEDAWRLNRRVEFVRYE